MRTTRDIQFILGIVLLALYMLPIMNLSEGNNLAGDLDQFPDGEILLDLKGGAILNPLPGGGPLYEKKGTFVGKISGGPVG